MAIDFENAYEKLFAYCQRENFAGYDPFDGLNSRIFQASPLKYFAFSRLAFLQLVKRSSKNLRPLLKIEKGINPKGIALFALAELARFRATFKASHAENAKNFLAKLLELKIPRGRKTAFGYNFDWQSRAFFAPQGTPTIVPTAFAAQAFLEGFQLFGEKIYRETLEQICKFIIEDLNRIGETEDEVCFSYTPLDKSVIFNASLLAGEVLANVGTISDNENYLHLSKKAANFVIKRQRNDGAWAYGTKWRHAWVDNFHTAYILLSLFRLQRLIPGFECREALEKGLDYWLENFFSPDGMPKYYDRKTFPIDIHSASAAVVALCELNEIEAKCLPLAEKVLSWSVENMRDEEGFFYYQKRADRIVKTSFIRWSQAWTAYALAKFLETQSRK